MLFEFSTRSKVSAVIDILLSSKKKATLLEFHRLIKTKRYRHANEIYLGMKLMARIIYAEKWGGSYWRNQESGDSSPEDRDFCCFF